MTWAAELGPLRTWGSSRRPLACNSTLEAQIQDAPPPQLCGQGCPELVHRPPCGLPAGFAPRNWGALLNRVLATVRSQQEAWSS